MHGCDLFLTISQTGSYTQGYYSTFAFHLAPTNPNYRMHQAILESVDCDWSKVHSRPFLSTIEHDNIAKNPAAQIQPLHDPGENTCRKLLHIFHLQKVL